MENAKRILIAFLIPFLSAFLLLWLGKYIYASPDSNIHFVFSDDVSPLQKQIYNLLAAGLFLLSVTLPLFVVSRNETAEGSELKLFNLTNKKF